jgi:hypothetical protein
LLAQLKYLLARKALEEAFQEDSDDEAEAGEGLLNLEEDDSKRISVCEVVCVIIHVADDVWDEDSAYLELLANEVQCALARLSRV